MYNIPPAPIVLDVACSAPDSEDPITAIQEAVDNHHAELVALLLEKQAIIDSLQNKPSTPKPLTTDEKSIVQDKLDALNFVSESTKGLKNIQCFDPNTKKGNYIGVIVHLTDHHIVQKAGNLSFVIHDRKMIEKTGLTIEKNDKLQIKYNAGRTVVNKVNPENQAPAAINKIMPPEQLEQLVKGINATVPLNQEQEKE